MKWYIFQILLWLDQGVNVLLGGWADETLSSRCHRNKDIWFWGILRQVINAVFFLQADHCLEAYNSELYRKHLPREFRPKAK